MKYRYLFGPVPSRRLGVSLGVDLLPYKTCSLDCVYCECGPTTALTFERKEYAPVSEVIAELADYLKNSPKLDYITFSGSGEPTLHSGIGRIIDFLKDNHPSYKIAVLTNGTLLHLPEVRKDIGKADLVVPSLDAVSQNVFETLNRPAHGLSNKKVIDGLVQFRAEFKGLIWLEIFIVPRINDTPEEIKNMKEAALLIKPDLIQLNTLDRPGAEKWVAPASKECLLSIQKELAPLPVQIVSSQKDHEQKAEARQDLAEAIKSVLSRRPCTTADLACMTGAGTEEINAHLRLLVKSGKVISKPLSRGVFYSLPG